MLLVETKILGLTKTIHTSMLVIFIGLTISPIPSTLDATLAIQAGISAPIFDIDLSFRFRLDCMIVF